MTSTLVNETHVAFNASVNDGLASVMQTLGQQDFLRLMVSQIQNQAPMQSQMNGEFQSKITQFSSNEALSQMQESMQKMPGSLQSNQALQASALVGRKVLMQSDTFKLGREGNVNIFVDVPSGATNIRVCIHSESGSLLKIIELGTKESGLFEFIWDGLGPNEERLPSGNYKIIVQGMCMEVEVGFNTLILGHVNSISFCQNGQGLRLNLEGFGAISLAQVKQITI